MSVSSAIQLASSTCSQVREAWSHLGLSQFNFNGGKSLSPCLVQILTQEVIPLSNFDASCCTISLNTSPSDVFGETEGKWAHVLLIRSFLHYKNINIHTAPHFTSPGHLTPTHPISLPWKLDCPQLDCKTIKILLEGNLAICFESSKTVHMFWLSNSISRSLCSKKHKYIKIQVQRYLSQQYL